MSEGKNDIVFNFGKYKNLPINECEDYSYLCRCVAHDWDKSNDNQQVRHAILDQISYCIKNEIYKKQWKNI